MLCRLESTAMPYQTGQYLRISMARHRASTEDGPCLQGDDPRVVARQFCSTHRLDAEDVAVLEVSPCRTRPASDATRVTETM